MSVRVEWENVFPATRASLSLPGAMLRSGGGGWQVHLCPLHLTGFPKRQAGMLLRMASTLLWRLLTWKKEEKQLVGNMS